MNKTTHEELINKLKVMRAYRSLPADTHMKDLIDILDALVAEAAAGHVESVIQTIQCATVRPGDILFVQVRDGTPDGWVQAFADQLFGTINRDVWLGTSVFVGSKITNAQVIRPDAVPPPPFDLLNSAHRAEVAEAYRLCFGPNAADVQDASETTVEQLRERLCNIGLTGPHLFWQAWHAVQTLEGGRS